MLSKSNLFRIKFIVSLLALSAVAMVGYVFYHSEKKEILDSARRDAAVLSDTVEQVLKHYMTEGERANLPSLLETIALLTSIERVRIYDRQGKVRFSSMSSETGTSGSISDETCAVCHDKEPDTRNTSTSFITKTGRSLLRHVNPIHNEKSCYRCHGAEAALLGVMMIDLSLSEAFASVDHFRKATFLLLVSITMVFGILVFLNQVFDYLDREPGNRPDLSGR